MELDMTNEAETNYTRGCTRGGLVTKLPCELLME